MADVAVGVVVCAREARGTHGAPRSILFAGCDIGGGWFVRLAGTEGALEGSFDGPSNLGGV